MTIALPKNVVLKRIQSQGAAGEATIPYDDTTDGIAQQVARELGCHCVRRRSQGEYVFRSAPFEYGPDELPAGDRVLV